MFTKRRKFVLTSVILSLGFVGVSMLDEQYRLHAIALLSVISLLLFYWSLAEGIERNATLLVLVLPALYTLGVGLFWFLLPSSIYATLPVVSIYGIGTYALVSTSNIFIVSAFRKIALSRAAKGVGFVLTLFTSFLLYDAILSLRLVPFLLVPIVFITTLPLYLQGIWAGKMSKDLPMQLLAYSAIASWGISIVALFLHFWPVTLVVGSIFLTVAQYVVLGLGQARIEGRLFKQTVREYLIVGAAVFVAMLFVTNWRG